MLISLWKEYQPKFQSSKFRNNTVWKEVSEKMWEANNNWHYSAMQCENKWKDLRKTYVKVKDYNNTSGNDPKTCKFYNDIDDILCDKPSITPVSIASNLRKRPLLTNNSNYADFENYSLNSDKCDYNEEVVSKGKKPRIEQYFNEWRADVKKKKKHVKEDTKKC